MAGLSAMAAALTLGALRAGAVDTPKGPPTTGGSIVVALGADPASLNPVLTTGIGEVLIGCSIYEGLTQVSADFKVEPLLAESWTISDDGKTYDFKLRQASWQDGKPFTSDDVKFSLFQVNAKYSPIFKASANQIAGIDTPSPDHAVIHLKEPFGPFLMSLSCVGGGAILPRHVFEGSDFLRNPASTTKPVGTGPFRLAEWARGASLKLVRNPAYRDKGKPHLDEVYLQILPQASSRIQALQSGDVDLILGYNMLPSDNAAVRAASNLRLEKSGYAPGHTFIAFNTARKPFNDPRVRHALFMATDRQYLVDSPWFGDGKPSLGPFSDAIGWAFNPAIDYRTMYPFDAAKANALLDEAGLPRDASSMRFKVGLVYPTDAPDRAQVALALKSMWRAVGVDLVPTGLERAALTKRVYEDHDFDLNLESYNTFGDPALGITRIYSSEALHRVFGNASGYSNPEVDKLFDEAQRATSQEVRGELYKKAEAILAADLPSMSLREKQYIDAASRHLHGVWDSMGPGDLANAWLDK